MKIEDVLVKTDVTQERLSEINDLLIEFFKEKGISVLEGYVVMTLLVAQINADADAQFKQEDMDS